MTPKRYLAPVNEIRIGDKIRISTELLNQIDSMPDRQSEAVELVKISEEPDGAKVLHLQRKDQRGVSTVEYAVMLVLIALAVMVFGTSISSSITGVFSKLASGLGQ